MNGRTAVLIFNLGGPNTPKAVRPFLRNLFSDPAILRMWAPMRLLLAFLISWRRAPVARSFYEMIGGSSPILEETRRQASALETLLTADGSLCRVFVAMRYWHPFASATAREIRSWNPDRIVLLPLYPQFSTTTTGSFLRVWKRASNMARLSQPTTVVCCWFLARGFVRAVAAATQKAIESLPRHLPYRVLFSAHGLPARFVETGDPYQDQVERSVAAVVDMMDFRELDHVVCYQSRVGRLKWLEPYTEDEIVRAGREERALIVVPIAFVSEHLETLVELDMVYRDLAAECGVPFYIRVATVGVEPVFVEGLAKMVQNTARSGIFPEAQSCKSEYSDCPCNS